MISKFLSRRTAITVLILLSFTLVLMCSHQYPSTILRFSHDGDSVRPETTLDELNIISYNVFLRPRLISTSEYTLDRAREIAKWLNNTEADVVTLQEAWNRKAVNALLNAVAEKFPYSVTDQPGRFGLKLISGGMLVLSRWPIEKVQTIAYEDCYGFDCRAAKGALHAVINLNDSTRINVVTTHLDAGEKPKDRQVRASQLNQLRQFVDVIAQSGDPLLITGDFNINSLAVDTEFYELMDVLDVDDYHVQEPSTINCDLETSIFCDEPVIPKRIDYIFARNRGDNLIRAETLHLKHATDKIDQFVRYLSDHRAVMARFKLRRDHFKLDPDQKPL